MTETRVLLGTEDGVRVIRRDFPGWVVEADGLRGQKVWTVAVQPGQQPTFFAGSYGHGLFRSDDGLNWRPSGEGIAYGHIRAIAFDPRGPRIIYVGTEPAAMFRSDDGGGSWRELDAIQRLPGASDWFLPYSPRRGAIRSIVVVPSTSQAMARAAMGEMGDMTGDMTDATGAMSQSTAETMPQTIYGGIEQGGVILSRDGGKSWQLLGGGVHPDIHQLLLSFANAAQVYAATGGGLFRSDDGGRTWARLLADYTRAVWQDPSNPACIWAGPAKRVGGLGTILRSVDGGATWHEAAGGLETPLADMVERFVGPIDHTLLAVTSGGRLLRTELERAFWTEPLLMPGIRIMTAAMA